jgi:AbrB family looped-hinge helix DNA binding protein
MSKVTGKLQLTLPKTIADRYGIRPGDEVEWSAGSDSLRLIPPAHRRRTLSRAERLAIFDASTHRQKRRQAALPRTQSASSRGWKREDLYKRAGSR